MSAPALFIAVTWKLARESFPYVLLSLPLFTFLWCRPYEEEDDTDANEVGP
jgi:hypothetical protein